MVRIALLRPGPRLLCRRTPVEHLARRLYVWFRQEVRECVYRIRTQVQLWKLQSPSTTTSFRGIPHWFGGNNFVSFLFVPLFGTLIWLSELSCDVNVTKQLFIPGHRGSRSHSSWRTSTSCDAAGTVRTWSGGGRNAGRRGRGRLNDGSRRLDWGVSANRACFVKKQFI